MTRPNTTSTIKDFTTSKIIVSEYWMPTMILRQINRENTLILQQKWQSNLGYQEWRDVAIEDES